MTPSVSVIVAIYQAGSYLARCLQSIVNQSLSNIELILVNDGSTDNSAQICDEFAKSYPWVKVFHKPHEGVSSARQVGIENASGEYSIHCDADDWMEPDMLKLMYAKAQETNADVVMCDIMLDFINSSCYVKQHPSKLDAETVLSELYNPIYACVWNKLIRHSLYKKWNIEYKKEVEHAEDLYVLLQLYTHPIKTECLSSFLYHYDKTQNVHSLTQDLDIDSVVRSMPYFEQLEPKTQSVVHKLKSYIMVDSYHRKIYKYERWSTLYPEVRRYILFEGLHFPRKRYLNIEPALALYHCRVLGRAYTWLMEKLMQLKKALK